MITSTLTRWRLSQLRRVALRSNESGVALLTSIFFMILAAGLSVVLLSAIISQAAPAIAAAKNTRTVYSAQAGLQTVLGLIRSSGSTDATGHVFGSPALLPCKSSGLSVASGRVNASGVGAYYTVTVDYFTSDPANTTDTWRSSNRIPCASLLSVPPVVPKYAYVYSGGKDAAAPATPLDGDRSLSAIYKFKVSNVNISGGPIYNSNGQFCLEAVTAVAGSQVKFVTGTPCPNGALDLWTYSTDYQLELASTTVGGLPGLCISDPRTGSDSSTLAAVLQACRLPADAARWNQLWSWTGDYSWRGQKNPFTNGPSNFCLSPNMPDGSNLSGRYLYVKNGCNGTFAPSSSVGAGAAGYATHQLVNYAEFGRCADVTNEQIASSFMISYPCKQDPTGTGVYLKWNHKWYYDEPPVGTATMGPQPIYVLDSSGTQKCLTTSPGASGHGDVTFNNCTSSALQRWTRVNDTGDYAGSYLMIDDAGRCLFTDTSDLFNTFYSKVRVTACNGSLAQKWNAPPVYVDSNFGGYREIAH
jgi:hypothetical protein